MVHFKASLNPHPLGIQKIEGTWNERGVPHPIWTANELNGVMSVRFRSPDAFLHSALLEALLASLVLMRLLRLMPCSGAVNSALDGKD